MKNCNNCKHLGLELRKESYSYYCTGMDYFKYRYPHLKEQAHLKQLQEEKYRIKSKVCFVKSKLSYLAD